MTTAAPATTFAAPCPDFRRVAMAEVVACRSRAEVESM